MFIVKQSFLFRIFDESRDCKMVQSGEGTGKSINSAKEKAFKNAKAELRKLYKGYSLKCKGIFKPMVTEL